MRAALITSALLVAVGLQTAVFATGNDDPWVVQARDFLGAVREGRLPAKTEVIVNVGGEQKYLSAAEAGKLLHSCREGVLKWTTISNRDGSLSPRLKTVETKFTCSGSFATYTDSAGVVLFQDDQIIRLVFQVDGYAASFPRRPK